MAFENTLHGFNLQHADDVQFTACRAEHNGENGYTYADASATSTILFDACTTDQNNQNGIAVTGPSDEADRAREQLEAIRPTDPNVTVGHRLVEGGPVEEILKVADSVKADIIVMGTHGHTGLSRLLMGSVAEGVMRKAPCPVLTIRSKME